MLPKEVYLVKTFLEKVFPKNDIPLRWVGNDEFIFISIQYGDDKILKAKLIGKRGRTVEKIRRYVSNRTKKWHRIEVEDRWDD